MSLDMKEIRKWAAAQGMTVGVRGPLSAEIISAYIAQGAIQRDGVAMGANGYHDDIINVMMAEQQNAGWYVLANGYIQNRTSTASLTVDGIKIAVRILRFFML